MTCRSIRGNKGELALELSSKGEWKPLNKILLVSWLSGLDVEITGRPA